MTKKLQWRKQIRIKILLRSNCPELYANYEKNWSRSLLMCSASSDSSQSVASTASIVVRNYWFVKTTRIQKQLEDVTISTSICGVHLLWLLCQWFIASLLNLSIVLIIYPTLNNADIDVHLARCISTGQISLKSYYEPYCIIFHCDIISSFSVIFTNNSFVRFLHHSIAKFSQIKGFVH